jgi:membrane protein DedA with SNARE-associated domain
VIVLSSIGYALGGQWSKINHGLTYVSYALVVVVVLAIVAFVLIRLREFRKEAAERAAVGDAPSGAGRHRQHSDRLGH